MPVGEGGERREGNGDADELSSFCLLDALRLPPLVLRGRLLVRCLDDRDKRWLTCVAPTNADGS